MKISGIRSFRRKGVDRGCVLRSVTACFNADDESRPEHVELGFRLQDGQKLTCRLDPDDPVDLLAFGVPTLVPEDICRHLLNQLGERISLLYVERGGLRLVAQREHVEYLFQWLDK